MLRVLGKIPREVVVAVSGGPDSMAILDFLSNNHNVTVAHFDHGTAFGKDCKYFVTEFCEERDIPLVLVASLLNVQQENPKRNIGDMNGTSSFAPLTIQSLQVIT